MASSAASTASPSTKRSRRLLALGALACAAGVLLVWRGAHRGGDVTGLPFYETADFTAEWIAPAEPRYRSIHTIAPFSLVDQEGVVVTGCELVGLIPLSAMLAAGRHYLRRQGINPGAPDAQLLEIAVQSRLNVLI